MIPKQYLDFSFYARVTTATAGIHLHNFNTAARDNTFVKVALLKIIRTAGFDCWLDLTDSVLRYRMIHWVRNNPFIFIGYS